MEADDQLPLTFNGEGRKGKGKGYRNVFVLECCSSTGAQVLVQYRYHELSQRQASARLGRAFALTGPIDTNLAPSGMRGRAMNTKAGKRVALPGGNCAAGKESRSASE